MRVTYDPEADAAYIYLVAKIERGGVAETVAVEELDDEVLLDLDRDGRLIGVDVLRASSRLRPELLAAAERLS